MTTDTHPHAASADIEARARELARTCGELRPMKMEPWRTCYTSEDLAAYSEAFLREKTALVLAALQAEREACAKICADLLRPGQLLLQAGEMTAQEKRTAKAVINYIAAAIRNQKEPTR